MTKIAKIFSTFAILALFLSYIISPLLGTYYLIYGSNLTRLILSLLLVYQYFFCKKNDFFLRIAKKFSIMNYFDEYNLVLDDKTIELRKEKTLICHHPHGVMTYGMAVLSAQHEFFNEYVYLGSRLILILPFGGILFILRGIQGVNHENFKKLMGLKKNIIIIPGGFEEATITSYTEDRVFIKERKGFIKYALQYGYKVYPSYCFNENKTYFYFTWIKLGLLLNKIKFPGVIFLSKFLNFLPNPDCKLITVIGEGIDMPLIEKPGKEDINKYHEIYIKNLISLYDKYKDIYGGSKSLKIY